jgi:hypothetical protein
MIFLPGMPWGYIGSLVMLVQEEMISLIGSQGVGLLSGLLDQSLSWGSPGRLQEEG